jgi:hypothetical protein
VLALSHSTRETAGPPTSELVERTERLRNQDKPITATGAYSAGSMGGWAGPTTALLDVMEALVVPYARSLVAELTVSQPLLYRREHLSPSSRSRSSRIGPSITRGVMGLPWS